MSYMKFSIACLLALSLSSLSLQVRGEPSVALPAPATKDKIVIVAEEATPVSQEGGPKIMLADPLPFENDYKGVVKIENSSKEPDYETPWLPGRFQSQRGTGFLIGNNLFLTNAHVVSNAQSLYISQYGDSRKLEAEILHIAHDCDLALLRVKDPSSFAGVKPFELGGLPKLEDEVRALGYPIGGERLSVTRGVVSRIDTLNYSHPVSDQHLVVQIDAAINPGNSGGPVFMGGKVVGVAFQGLRDGEGLGYVIPVPVILHFLQDIKDGKYDGYSGMGIREFPILNPAMRAELGLPDDEKGVLVGNVYKEGGAAGILECGDVLLKIDGRDVDSSGMISIDGERLSMNELAERKFAGDKLKVEFIRNKEKKEAEITLKQEKFRSVISAEYDKMPRYVISGGLVFQPAQRNTIQAHSVSTPALAKAIEECMYGINQEGKEDIVFITQVLTDDANLRLDDVLYECVEKVNGTPVRGLSHLHELLNPAEKPEFFVIEITGGKRPIVLDAKTLDAVNERVARQYDINENARLDPQSGR